MGLLSGFRDYTRTSDGLMFPLPRAEWPSDLPIYPDAYPIGTIPPQCRINLHPDRTTELVLGWFNADTTFPPLLHWYQTTMRQLGWLPLDQGYEVDTSAGLYYQHPSTEVMVRIILRATLDPMTTTILLWRNYTVAWSPRPSAEPDTPPPEREEAEREAEGECHPDNAPPSC